MKKIYVFVLMVFFCPMFSVSDPFAQPVRTDYVESELVAEEESIQPGRAFWIALRLKMDEHWHTYWRNPGDAGLPTNIQWTLPEGFTAGSIQWPYPQKINLPPLSNYGYEGEVFLLTEITPPSSLTPGMSVDIQAFADWLVCEEVCLPGMAGYVITLPVSADPPKAAAQWADAFASTRASLPLTATEWNIQAVATDSLIDIQAVPPAWFTGELTGIHFFPFAGEMINHADPQAFRKTGSAYRLTVNRSNLMTGPLDRVQGVLVTQDGWRGSGSERALEIDVPVGASLTAVTGTLLADETVTGPWLALAFAFIGGLILNLMPCVLPVLSIKVLGFVHQAGEDRRKSRQHGLMFTAGVLLSFLTLAGALIALRAGGEQLGWGFQLQSPLFVVVISSILFLFGLSLFGVFEIGTSVAGTGGRLDTKTGLSGSFFSGVLATVVATPCTAPFMGPALGFALTQTPAQSLLIFAFLGLGMAAPYLALSSAPSLLRFVPKPGAWMESFKQFMGFLMMATVVWLAWVLGIQAGPDAVAMMLGLLVLLGLGAWILGRWGSVMVSSDRTRFVGRTVAGIIMVGSLGYTLSILPGSAAGVTMTRTAAGNGLNWEPFSSQRVAALREAGKPVFVDFTAAWCLSCQVNERVALHNRDVVQKFEELNIVPLKADWTSRDPEITQALAQFGRNSVPLYVLYTGEPGAEPKILPEILTPGIVLEALTAVKPTTTARSGNSFISR